MPLPKMCASLNGCLMDYIPLMKIHEREKKLCLSIWKKGSKIGQSVQYHST